MSATRLACGPKPCDTPKRRPRRWLGALWSCPWCGTVFKLRAISGPGDTIYIWDKTDLVAR